MQQMFLGLGAVAAIEITVSDGDTNLNASTLFGSDFAADVAKILIISSGHEIGGTGTGGNRALTIPSGMGGTLDIQNAGTISGSAGAGGSGGSGGATGTAQGGSSGGSGSAGGSAIYVASANVTITNTGTIRGGGGGGNGGSGGTSAGAGHAYPTHESYYVSWLDCLAGGGGTGGNGGTGQGYGTSATSGTAGSAGLIRNTSPQFSGHQYNQAVGYCNTAKGGQSTSAWNNTSYGSAGQGQSGYTGGDGGSYGNAGNSGGAAGKYIELAGGISLANTPSGTLQGTAP